MQDLVSAEEIAERLGVEPNSVANWKRRDVGFPSPVKTLRRTAIWAWPDVEAWARETGRLPERD